MSTVSSDNNRSDTDYLSDAEHSPRPNQYHSLFYRILSWKDPRSSAIAFAASAFLIIAGHFLPIIRLSLKALYWILGATASIEVVSSFILGNGITTRARPQQYFTISPDSLQRFLNDFADLTNFFVVEFQRIVFAENIYVTSAAWALSFISYWLVQFAPLWILVLLADFAAFLGPLVYLQNKELIDSYLHKTSALAQEHANNVRDAAYKRARLAVNSVQEATAPYTSRITGGVPKKTAVDEPHVE